MAGRAEQHPLTSSKGSNMLLRFVAEESFWSGFVDKFVGKLLIGVAVGVLLLLLRLTWKFLVGSHLHEETSSSKRLSGTGHQTNSSLEVVGNRKPISDGRLRRDMDQL